MLVAPTARGSSDMDKLSPELQALFQQMSTARGSAEPRLSARDLRERFGIREGDTDPAIEIAITTRTGVNAGTARQLRDAGVMVWRSLGRFTYAGAPVSRLPAIARLDSVQWVEAVQGGDMTPPGSGRASRGGAPRGDAALPTEFDHRGLTGKGVLIAVVDTGIDWRHPDFIRPDGSSRIVKLWDLYDPSWEKSEGKIGMKPPFEDAKGRPLGTVYTREQITAALHGTGEVNSTDHVGHGTACMGVAAGNGRAGAGKGGEKYVGVAPEADLIVVDIAPPDSHGELNSQFSALGTVWAVDVAERLKKPLVVNMSYGSHVNAHNGKTAEETIVDRLSGPGKPGVVFCAAAGNNGREPLHASQIFGPRRAGEKDIQSDPIELFVTTTTVVSAYFDHRDDWGLAVTGTDNFLVDADGHPDHLLVWRSDRGAMWKVTADPKAPENPETYMRQFLHIQNSLPRDEQTDELDIQLPPGRYFLQGFASSERVKSGEFDLYLPHSEDASFGKGVTFTAMVTAPANAANVITVGSYDFRGSWPNTGGNYTLYNVRVGALSSYSNPGYRRDGRIKPDIAAPARYAISSVPTDSLMAKETGASHLTPDGFHIAWDGTSAASPFAAGVVALMLQKNPKLDAEQVRGILTRTARHDSFTGSTPNPQWGFGKIDPSSALKVATAAPGAPAQRVPTPKKKPGIRPGK